MPPKLNPLEAIKQSKGAKAVGSLADQVRAEMAAEKAATRARGMLVAGEEFADPMNPSNIMRMSEALGNAGAEGKTLKVTQADRSRVFGPNKGGTGFSGMQLTSKPHQQARSTWGVGKQSHQTRLSNATDDNTIWSTFIGSPTQHMSNPVTVQRMYEEFNKAKPSAGLVQKMNEALNNATHPKTGKLIFPDGIDISNPSELTKATTFDQRKLVAKAMTIGGEKKGEKATQEAFKVIREETDPLLADSPTYAVGNRLFTIDKNSGIYRPDLNSAFPYITTGDDMGLLFKPAPVEQALPTFVKRFAGRLDKNLKPTPMGHKDLTATTPTEFIDEAYLTNLQKQGNAKGGLIRMAKGGAMRGIKKLKGIYGEVESSMGRGKGAEFEQTASPLNIIRETGSNWSPSGDSVYKSRLDRELEKLEKGKYDNPSNYIKTMLEDAVKKGDTRQVEVLTANLRSAIGNEAANKWVQSNLRNYITKQMATEADPVRKLAEQGITAFPKNVDEYGDLNLRDYGSAEARVNRQITGNAPKGVAKSPLAKHYETMTDESLTPTEAEHFQRIQALPKRQRPVGATADIPWVNKLDPKTPLFSLSQDADFDKLGFNHMMDVLREDVAAGRIRPEQLSKITIEQAVRRTHDYDETLKANMLNARIAEQANANVFKEYPEGYRWVQLDKPGQFALESDIMGHSVRGYEPPKGHSEHIDISGDSGSSDYGHGGYEAIKSGDAKVYSLRDPKGRSHVTVEVGTSNPNLEFAYAKQNLPDLYAKYSANRNDYFNSWPEFLKKEAPELLNVKEPKITQIKGKQNAAPNEEYLPFVQDFVKSGQWSEVGDISNTGLMDVKYMTNPETYQKYLEQGLDVPKYATEKELDQLHNEYLRLAEPRNYKPPAEGMARGGLAYMGKGGAAKGAKTVMSLADQVRAEMAAEKAGAKVPKTLSAGDVVNGMLVRKDIPNQSSIGASLYDYSTHGVQEVPMSAFETVGKPKYRTVQEEQYTKELARQIQENKELNPLIVVKDAEGYYILEGGHRFDALRELEIDSFPALMVHDLESLGEQLPVPPVTKANGGLAYMGKGGAPKGVKKVMSLADQVRAEMAMEKRVLPAAEREANLAKFLERSAIKNRVYHGTNADFGKFDPVKLGGATNARTTGLGFFSTDNELVANRFADSQSGANVMPLHVNIQNPVELGHRTAKERSSGKDPFIAMQEAITKIAGKKSWNDVTPEDVAVWKDRLVDRGYDGIVLRKTIMDGAGGATARTIDDPYHDFYIAFHPEQMKSATGNRGTYDINDPDITKAHGGLTSLKRKAA